MARLPTRSTYPLHSNALGIDDDSQYNINSMLGTLDSGLLSNENDIPTCDI